MARKGAFVLTPVGSKPGRYEVTRNTAPGSALSQGKLSSPNTRVYQDASPRSKDTIKDIVRTHAGSLKRLADR